MSTVNVVWTTQAQSFPAGTTADHFDVMLIDSTGGVVAQETAALSATNSAFQSVLPGTYTVAVSLRDASNNLLGSVASSTAFTIAAPAPVDLQVPAVVTVSVS